MWHLTGSRGNKLHIVIKTVAIIRCLQPVDLEWHCCLEVSYCQVLPCPNEWHCVLEEDDEFVLSGDFLYWLGLYVDWLSVCAHWHPSDWVIVTLPSFFIGFAITWTTIIWQCIVVITHLIIKDYSISTRGDTHSILNDQSAIVTLKTDIERFLCAFLASWMCARMNDVKDCVWYLFTECWGY